jgi:signal transduction histidine kinase
VNVRTNSTDGIRSAAGAINMPDPAPPDVDPQLTELKLRALAEFAAGAGHEINNPVATIVGYVQQLLADERDPDRRHALSTIGAQAYRIRDMIGDCMLFARPPQPQPEPLELVAVVREVTARVASDAREALIDVGIVPGDVVPIFADPVQLRVVIGSLLRNSLEALAAGGKISIEARSVRETGRDMAVLSMSDNGPGLSPSDREHLFDPFYSGRQAGRGLGFGLAKTWRIVTLHSGRIEVTAPQSGGVTMTIYWPATIDSAAPQP